MLQDQPNVIAEIQQASNSDFDDYGFENPIDNNAPNVAIEIKNLMAYRTTMPVLKFWASCGDEFPILKRLARRYLSIPATSASSERVFSKVKLFQSRLRNQIPMDKINQMVLARTLLKNEFPIIFE